MFISVLELFKIGIGPSSSHTVGPMLAALDFRNQVIEFYNATNTHSKNQIKCVLTGSLAFTGKGHATDRAVILGLHGYTPEMVVKHDLESLISQLWNNEELECATNRKIDFRANKDIIFDRDQFLDEHPNGLIFELLDNAGQIILSETYFSIGGGFILTKSEFTKSINNSEFEKNNSCAYAFDSASSMLAMSNQEKLSIAEMKRHNELGSLSEKELNEGLDNIWHAMKTSVENGLTAEGSLPGGLKIERRAKQLLNQYQKSSQQINFNDWLCLYAMSVNEENAAGHMVVTAPTNGAAGVIPSVIYYMNQHEQISIEQIREFLLVAAAIGGLIKHRGSISGAEVGCQGEVGSAAAMAAAGLCSIRGGTTLQIENAAEIALEHHLGMTCDPVNGLVQVPCIERNGFGAIKAFAAASLALHGTGEHFISLDNCIAAMQQTGLEMSAKYKETALGGLAVNFTEC